MLIADIPAEGGVAVRLVILLEAECDPIVLAIEHVDQLDEHIVLGSIRVQREVEILRESPRGAEDRLSQAGATLDRPSAS
jgi:hypothetical protein